MDTGIHIGPKVEREVVTHISETVLRILDARADQKTIRAALRVVERATSIGPSAVSNTSISNCYIGGAGVRLPSDDPPPSSDSDGSDEVDGSDRDDRDPGPDDLGPGDPDRFA